MGVIADRFLCALEHGLVTTDEIKTVHRALTAAGYALDHPDRVDAGKGAGRVAANTNAIAELRAALNHARHAPVSPAEVAAIKRLLDAKYPLPEIAASLGITVYRARYVACLATKQKA